MSITGGTIGIDKAAMIDLVGNVNTVDAYAQNDDDNITKAIDAIVDAFRSAAIKGGYSIVSIDGLTSATTPVSVKRWILHGALDELTSGGMSRPDSIGAFGVEFRKWLSRLAGGAETIEGLSSATSTGGSQMRSEFGTNIFDRDNTLSPWPRRDPRL